MEKGIDDILPFLVSMHYIRCNFSSSQDYLDDKLVTLTDFARAVRVLELTPSVQKTILATTIYGIKKRLQPIRWT